jgi:hypothetical protein
MVSLISGRVRSKTGACANESPQAVECPGRASYPVPRDFDGTPPRCTGRDALAAFDLAVAADRSWRSGRPVTVKPAPVEGGVVYEIEES